MIRLQGDVRPFYRFQKETAKAVKRFVKGITKIKPGPLAKFVKRKTNG